MAILYGDSRNNIIAGTVLGDSIFGLAGNDMLRGGVGNDMLDGGLGSDNMEGGTGDDTYVVDNGFDILTEATTSGLDTVRASVSHTLGLNVENLIQTGAGHIIGTGNGAGNRITGNLGDNRLFGLSGSDTLGGGSGGNDYLDGGAGADSMSGGAGNDTYMADNANDTVTEAQAQGQDSVRASVSYVLGANVEILYMASNAGNIDGTGNAGDNKIFGNDSSNRLNGAGGNDLMDGLGGADWIDGGTGIDELYGGKGDDTFVLADNWNDKLYELAGEGHDTIRSLFSHTLKAQFEDLVLTGAWGVAGYGNGARNFITGNGGNNTLDGRLGDDVLEGGAGNDILVGDEGNDILDGGTGGDRLEGGNDSDLYYVGHSADVVVEASVLGGGQDRVVSTISYTLGQNVENLTLKGGIAGTGNALDNIIQVDGPALNATLTGLGGNDRLYGGSGNDTLDGGGEQDTLWGAGGRDVLIGGTGADRYVYQRIEDSSTGASQSDVIKGFTAGEGLGITGIDVIDLSLIDANTSAAGNQAFQFFAQTAAVRANAVTVFTDAATGVTNILVDVNGDTNADMRIVVEGTPFNQLVASDFVL